MVFGLLLAAWAVGIWATMIRGTTQEVVGSYVARPTPSTILVRHEALPQLDMVPMDLMTFTVDPATLIDEARLVPGDRVRLRARQRADGVTVLGIVRIP